MNIEIKNLLCARNARARIHARVYAPAQGSLSPPPCPVVSQNSAFRKITREVFPKSPLVFDGTPQVSKFASFSSVKVCISRIVFLPLPSKDTQLSALLQPKDLFANAFPTLSALTIHRMLSIVAWRTSTVLSHLVNRTKRASAVS